MFGIGSASCSTAAVDPKSFPDPAEDLKVAANAGPQTLVLGGGCFWCTEGVFEQVEGVIDVVSGYAGGTKETAVYEIVCTGTTDHAEVIQITYDPARVSFGKLMKIFFSIAHDPTQLNRQGPDTGRQYRSAIFYANDDQKRVAEAYIRQLNEAKVFGKPIVTTLEPLNGFFEAERYHQDYTRQHCDNPYIIRNALPKVEKLKKYQEAEKPAATQPADR